MLKWLQLEQGASVKIAWTEVPNMWLSIQFFTIGVLWFFVFIKLIFWTKPPGSRHYVNGSLTCPRKVSGKSNKNIDYGKRSGEDKTYTVAIFVGSFRLEKQARLNNFFYDG